MTFFKSYILVIRKLTFLSRKTSFRLVIYAPKYACMQNIKIGVVFCFKIIIEDEFVMFNV